MNADYPTSTRVLEVRERHVDTQFLLTMKSLRQVLKIGSQRLISVHYEEPTTST